MPAMTTRQALAYNDACFDAEKTQDRRFGSTGIARRWKVSVVLTANIGLE